VIGAASAQPAARTGEWAGYPKGAWLIIGVEFCPLLRLAARADVTL
jgi:hypothetical protein